MSLDDALAAVEAKKRKLQADKDAEAAEQARSKAKRDADRKLREKERLELEKQQEIERIEQEKQDAIAKVELERKEKEKSDLLAKIPFLEKEIASLKKGMVPSPSPAPSPSLLSKGIPQNSADLKIRILGEFANEYISEFGYLKDLKFKTFRLKGNRLIKLIPKLKPKVELLQVLSARGATTTDSILLLIGKIYSQKPIPNNTKQFVRDLVGENDYEGKKLYDYAIRNFEKVVFREGVRAIYPNLQGIMDILDYLSRMGIENADNLLKAISQNA